MEPAAELPARIRAFVAIRMGAEVNRAIAELIRELRRDGDGVRWTSDANLHLTLKFLGPSVSRDKIDALIPEFTQVAKQTSAFEVIVAGLGAFPNLNRAQVLWAGIGSADLNQLAARIDEACLPCGFAREARPFTGHLTLARMKAPSGWKRIRGAVETVREREFGRANIKEFTLYRSRTDPAGAIYKPLMTFPLRERA
jgi:RNA 2',3'-cyclic 3'-phosphodiesterase